jgi:succinate dehydrogenase / fumarate reductase cytochrome b subunit
MSLKRAVVTGLGALTPVGHTAEETWTNLLAGKSGAGPITRFDASLFKTHFACEVKGFVPNDLLDRKEARRMDGCSQLAFDAVLIQFLRFTQPLNSRSSSIVSKKRPVNLDIATIRLPITSYVSILHRVSGVILFFAVAVLLFVLETSLKSEQSFESLRAWFANPLFQFIIWGCLAALAYHVIAGLRHLVMDFGFGEDSFDAGRRTAWVAAVLATVTILAITIGVFLW